MPGVLHPDPDAYSKQEEEEVEDTNPEIEVPDLETGLALALSMCPDGETITVHEAHCIVTPEHPDRCNCDAQVYRPVRA